MGVSAAIGVGSMLVSAVVGNQEKQKAKGQAAQVERDSQAAQAAADAKLQQTHDANIQSESQAGQVARNAVSATPARDPNLVMGGTGNAKQGATASTLLGGTRPIGNASAIPGPLVQPIQRKTLLGT